MPNRYPDYDYFTQEEWDQFQTPLVKVDSILRKFAQKQKFCFDDYFTKTIERRLWYRRRSQLKDYYIDKVINLSLFDKENGLYGISVGVINSYGHKNFYAFIPFLRKKWKSFKYFNWGKTLGEFKREIDSEKLKQLLEQAKQILDNFDESLLQEVKQS